MSAPVFDASGEVALLLALRGFAEPVTGAEVAGVGARLVDAADSVTDASGGRRPGGASRAG